MIAAQNQMSLCRPLAVLLMATLLAPLLPAQDTEFPPAGQQIPSPRCALLNWYESYSPCTAALHDAWLADITHWRTERRIRIGYSGALYEASALRWTQSSFIQPQMMVHDRYFYDPASGHYTVDRYLADLKRRYGGIDAVLVWSTYPNMGIDDRNQIDMVRSMPGGTAGVRQMVSDFHRHGVRVFFPMMMWDQGTRRPVLPWTRTIAEFMKSIAADGVNGDTQDGVPRAFTKASEEAGHLLAFEPENSPADEAVAWNVMTWGQYHFPFTPEIDRFKWLEPRHMVNISDRWSRNKNDDLQFAFFNGIGWESWENIWGIWNGITPRDAEATRRMATLERGIAPFLVSAEWEPLYPMRRYGVFASRWPLGGETLWTIVNRNEYDVSGGEMRVPVHRGVRYFDLYHGSEIAPQHEGDHGVLSFPIEAHGYGAVLATEQEPSSSIRQLMATMSTMTGRSLSSYSAEWQPLPQVLVPISATRPTTAAPAKMVEIPAGDFEFRVRGIEIEGGNDAGIDVQYPWEQNPRRFHEHGMHIARFYIDKYPVTNAEYRKFLLAANYRPKDPLNFLKDWRAGMYPAGWGNKPVTWVSIEDARAYAQWAGKRLPHEWEWQYAAQGADGSVYPWGNSWLPGNVPMPDTGRSLRGPDNVDAHPAGASPFGVMDMAGNIWQWTEEFADEHTRAAVLRGGSYYQPQGSRWYFPQAYRNDQHGKYLLMAPSIDRAGTLGFRCVADAN